MKKIFILIFFLIVGLAGCENTDTVEIPLPYQEDVVIQGQLVAGETFKGIRITKTLNINETYDIKKAEIKNAFAYLKINDVQIIPLHYTSDGMYLPIDTLFITNGDKFELYGEASGNKFYSETLIPHLPVVKSSNYNSSEYYLEASVQSYPNETYGSLWIIDKDLSKSATDFFSITNSEDLTINPISTTRTQYIPERYRSLIYDGRRYIQVYAFDKQFKSFFNSKDSNRPAESYFQEGGGAIAWNVFGDHVIGLFIGIAKSHI